MSERIANEFYRSKVMSADEAAQFVPDQGMDLGHIGRGRG